MIIGQTHLRHQAFAYSSPMKDALQRFFFCLSECFLTL